MKAENVAIIGAGPAGTATAIQLKRHGIAPNLFEKSETGGLLRNANLVENYPGFPGGISGLNLVNLFEKQLRESGIKVIYEEVTKLDLEDGMFLVETPGRICYSQVVVVASGTKPRRFTDFELPEGVRDKILYEIYPILRVKRKKIAIVGAGDAAFDYALNLGKNNEVVILNRGEAVKCLPILRERARVSPRITYCENTEISRIMSGSQNRMLLECMGPEGISKLYAHFVVFAIGREPQLDFLSEKLRDNAGEMENRGVLYFVGDVKNGAFRQTAIAVGDGIMAAMKIYRRLEEAYK
ncbi:MAG: NAD(P)/FAD-dependent oxidoreductase [Chloroflexi bacterium]|nr:NAD(P)/FAD-dependent oxidoreductase [Chloroflexota bacterium]